ncbi:MAG: outer membrane lipoprotein carrier protein LolA [bacterium]|nr:outer membrane lipoprotein carrier protein LolA [bacterium]
MFLAVPAIASDSISQKIQAVYRETETFSADFKQTVTIPMMEKVIQKSGHLVLAKPGKFFIQYRQPEKKEYISDGKTLWIYRPDDKEVEVYDSLGEQVAQEGLSFLGGLADLEKEFLVISQKQVADGYELILRPRQKTTFEKIILQVDASDFLVRAMTFFPEGGNKSRTVFSNFRRNGEEKQNFKFKVPYGVRKLHP